MLFFAGCSKQAGPNSVPLSNEVPLLSEDTITIISGGDIFLKHFHDGRFVKFTEEKHFDKTRKTVVLVHGLFESSDKEWLNILAARIRKIEPQTNIVAVDWSKHSLISMEFDWESITGEVIDAYKKVLGTGKSWIVWKEWTTKENWTKVMDSETWKDIADKKPTRQMLEVANVVKFIPSTGEQTAEYLFSQEGLAINPQHTHIIGFSHGAHICGFIGRTLKSGKFNMAVPDFVIKRITVLDPSTRIVHFENLNVFGNGWDENSAEFIDMYQTSFWAGTGKTYGHKTWQVLNEKNAKEWLPPLTPKGEADRHNYAPKWFASTVGKSNEDYGYSALPPKEELPKSRWGDKKWSGTIISTLPYQPVESDYDTATDTLQP